MRRSSTLLSRLALALLVALGFVAPQAPVERDRVVQFVPGAPTTPESRVEVVAPLLRRPTLPTIVHGLRESRGQARGARYLLHRAWLL